MPVQQIAVGPAARETASNGKSAPRSKDKAEGRKAPGRSGSRSSNLSKASNSGTGLATASRTSVTPSSQDICSQLTPLDEEASESHKHNKHTHGSAMAVGSSAQAQAQAHKKQVKRRHRRKRSGAASAVDCVEAVARQEQSDRSLSSDRSEQREKRERASKGRRELAPRLRTTGARHMDSSSEDEECREARSWSKEKARRVRRRSGNSLGRDEACGSKGVEVKTEVMELQSVDSDEEKASQQQAEDGGGLKKRHGGGGRSSSKRDGSVSPREASQSRDREKSRSPAGSSSLADDGEELITKSYQEKGPGGGDMSVPTPQTRCGVNGNTPHPYSDDSELEVCRICHCEGDDECLLIMPCHCTGSLSFVHQACLNQWIKSSDTRCCELCKFDFIMETKLKPLRKWERLNMTKSERRKIFCSVMFHLIALACMLWSVYVLAKRTAEEIRQGKNEDFWRFTLLKEYDHQEGVLEWPFWTKLIVVAIGFTGGLIFMYIQCKIYLQLWRRLKAFNRIITVQNCPEKGLHGGPQAPRPATNGTRQSVAVPVGPAPVPPATEAQGDSEDMSVEEAVAPPAQNPV